MRLIMQQHPAMYGNAVTIEFLLIESAAEIATRNAKRASQNPRRGL